VLIGAAMFGVVLGGVSTWLRQGRHRKAARAAKATAENLRAENGQLRGQIATLKTPAASTALAPLDAA
jgi:cell division protein FtsB